MSSRTKRRARIWRDTTWAGTMFTTPLQDTLGYVATEIYLSAETVMRICRHCNAMRAAGASEDEVRAAHFAYSYSEEHAEALLNGTFYIDTDRPSQPVLEGKFYVPNPYGPGHRR